MRSLNRTIRSLEYAHAGEEIPPTAVGQDFDETR